MMGEKKQKKIKRPSRIAFCLMSLLLVVLVGINVAVGSVVTPYFPFIQNFLDEPPTDEASRAATEKSAAITRQVEEEGIVLLTNNGTLPVASGNINVFGSGAANFTYGGTGSGSGDSSDNVTIYQGLENAGFVVNEELKTFTQENTKARQVAELVGNDFSLYEIPVSAYTEDLLSNAKAFSDTAVVVISRSGGEGDDCPMDMEAYGGEKGTHYLELQSGEQELLSMVKESFTNVIVVLNSPNTMELGFLEDEDIDAALWVGCPGSTGCNAIGEVLAGVVNPSGRTTDIFAYEVESAPSYYNFGDYDYSNITYANVSMFAGTGTADTGEDNYHYVEYVEGIYVGYRYYETAAADGFIDYDTTVQFPFGYGLSYTTFTEKISDFRVDGNDITVEVTVKNTGKTAGKDVVEVYYTAPYTRGGIEKAQVVLVGFAKTSELAAGESETVTISFAYEDMASYDYSGVKAQGGAYVLEAGEYQIQVQTDSHHVADSRTVTVDRDYIYNEENDGARSTDAVSEETGEAITNQLADVDIRTYDSSFTYLSRSDWTGTWPTVYADGSWEAPDELLAALEIPVTEEDEDAVMPVFDTVTEDELKLADLIGADYDDPRWETLLNQAGRDELYDLVRHSGYGTYAIDSLGLPGTIQKDGPAGISSTLAGGNLSCMAYPPEVVVASTWNLELVEEFGKMVGEDSLSSGVSVWYAPAMNIHRSAYSGRNFEYYSEDSFLSGKMGAAEVAGFQSKGGIVTIKHFALNDQETNRIGGAIFANEQAARELYLKPFEMSITEGGAVGIMSSMNRIGARWIGSHEGLMTNILRNEWNYKGFVITDQTSFASFNYCDIIAGLAAGNDMWLNTANDMWQLSEEEMTATLMQNVRTAAHRFLYAVANSNVMNGVDHDTTVKNVKAGWQKLIPPVAVIMAVVFVALMYAAYCLWGTKKHIRRKQERRQRKLERKGLAK